MRPFHEILCTDIAHSLLDEAGGPTLVSGASLVALPSDDGILDPAQLDRRITRRGDVHHSQPRIVTITQSTENGRVWQPDGIAAFIDHAHELDLLVHVDGSRIANAVAALDVPPALAVGDADIVTIGGTKNGMLFGDAILVRRPPEHFADIEFVQKQIGHLASKHRYVSAQFDAMLSDGVWLQAAGHANAMAARLSVGITNLGLHLSSPTEANEVFVDLPAEALDSVREHFAVHAPDPHKPPGPVRLLLGHHRGRRRGRLEGAGSGEDGLTVGVDEVALGALGDAGLVGLQRHRDLVAGIAHHVQCQFAGLLMREVSPPHTGSHRR